jgi:heptosyltransferase-2
MNFERSARTQTHPTRLGQWQNVRPRNEAAGNPRIITLPRSVMLSLPVTGPRPLAVRLRNWVGDVVLGVPALRLLAEHGYALDLVGKRWAASLLEGEGWPVQTLATSWRGRADQLRAWATQARAQDPTFSARPNALCFPFSFSSALDMRLAGLRAVGYACEGRSLLLHRALAMPQGVHELERYWLLACAFLGVQRPPPDRIGLKVSDAARERAHSRLAAHSLHSGQFTLLCPFAGGTFEKQDKRWPGFAALAARLHEQGHTLVLCPGPGEAEEARAVHPQALVWPEVPLADYAALAQQAQLMVSNDTGPGHLAAAVGCPLVSVLGPTQAGQWGAWGPSVRKVQGHGHTWPELGAVLQAVQAGAGPQP